MTGTSLVLSGRSATVWKFVLSADALPPAEQQVEMPRDAEILSVQPQGTRIVMWVRCFPEEKDWIYRRILISATGESSPGFDVEHVGTVQLAGYVWHVFDGGEKEVE